MTLDEQIIARSKFRNMNDRELLNWADHADPFIAEMAERFDRTVAALKDAEDGMLDKLLDY